MMKLDKKIANCGYCKGKGCGVCNVWRIEQLKSKGVSAYIRKPFTPEQLHAVVDDIMGVKNES